MTIDCQGLREQEAHKQHVPWVYMHAVVVLIDNELHIFAKPSFLEDFSFWEKVRSAVSPSSIIVKHGWTNMTMDLARMTRTGYPIKEFGKPLPGFIVVYTERITT